MKRAVRYIIFYSALLGLWALIAELKIWPPPWLNSPNGSCKILLVSGEVVLTRPFKTFV